MTRPRIAIDIDDVLADNAKGFIQFSNDRWGTTLQPSDYQEHWSNMWQVDHDEAERRSLEFHEFGGHVGYEHIDHAFEALMLLKERYDLVIVTSRRRRVKGETLAWLDQHYPGIFTEDQIYFAGIWDEGITEERYAGTKVDIIKELDAQYLIDDQLKHCLAAAEEGVQVLLFGDYSWNQIEVLPKNMTRVNGWKAVLEYFNGRA